MHDTDRQYQEAFRQCRDVFTNKARDYGTSWRVLRPISIVDQIFIKAQRIRNIQELGEQRVGDNVTSEFKGIVNYGIIGLIQLDLKKEAVENLDAKQVETWFDAKSNLAARTMEDKNHDYGEAWREMSQESFVDMILMKLMRARQIISNEGKTIVSEGLDANYIDIINYALFALISISEGKHPG